MNGAAAATINDLVAALCTNAQNALTTSGQFKTMQAILGIIGDIDISMCFVCDASYYIVDNI